MSKTSIHVERHERESWACHFLEQKNLNNALCMDGIRDRDGYVLIIVMTIIAIIFTNTHSEDPEYMLDNDNENLEDAQRSRPGPEVDDNHRSSSIRSDQGHRRPPVQDEQHS